MFPINPWLPLFCHDYSSGSIWLFENEKKIYIPNITNITIIPGVFEKIGLFHISCLISSLLWESTGNTDSPGHLTFNCSVHIFVAIQRMVKRVFFSKKSYNLFLEFATIICTPQLKVRCPGESAFPVDSQNVQDFYCRPFISCAISIQRYINFFVFFSPPMLAHSARG